MRLAKITITLEGQLNELAEPTLSQARLHEWSWLG